MQEVVRVLVPDGVAFLLASLTHDASLAPEGCTLHPVSWIDGEGTKLIKLRPDAIDAWSHYLYDASNNALSKDEVVAPPKGLQWWAGPFSSRSHNWVPSTGARVSSGGRLFYLRDDGPIAAMPHKGTGMNWSYERKPMPEMPEEWSLIARDAFNGKELWRRPLEGFGQTLFEDPGFGPTAWNIWSLPLSVKRRLVATPKRVYVTLAYRGGLSALDAATGKTVWEYQPEEGLVDEVIADADRIFVKMRRAIPRKLDQPFYREGLDAAWGKTFTGEEYDKYVESQPPEMVAAVDAEDGRQLWRFDAPRVGAETLCTLDGAVL
jgi:outer membrane protein assembly factor BamB